jgi:predicted phosphodiesterase
LKSSKKPENVLVIPDIHYRKKPGGEDRRSLDAVKKYASDLKWSHVVFLGDVMDHDGISDHNKGNLRSISDQKIMADYEVGNRELDEWEQVTPGAQKIILEGNHDYRPERLVDAQPQLKGLVETPIGLKLEKRGWLWVPYWSTGETFDLGRASYGHGRYTSDYHAAKHAHRYGRNFYYGHLHDTQSYTVERDGDDLKYEAASLGCLCAYRQYYLKGRPTRWQQMVTKFSFQPNGNFNRYSTAIFNHRFISPEGKFYQA